MKTLRHRVQINIADRRGVKKKLLASTRVRLPQRLVEFLFGEFSEILVLTPGVSVEDIEIHEMKGGASDVK